LINSPGYINYLASNPDQVITAALLTLGLLSLLTSGQEFIAVIAIASSENYPGNALRLSVSSAIGF